VVGTQPFLVKERVNDLLEVVLLLTPADVQQATLHELRGDTFFARKLFDDAIIEYRKAIALDRYNASVVNRLGLAYHQTQKVKEAEQQYRQALRLNPFYLEALNNLGSIEYVLGRFNRAMDQYQKALKIRPDSPTVLMNIGACLFAMERYDEGYLLYQRALQIDPRSFERTSSAGTLIQTAQRNESVMNFYLAKVFAGSGDVDRAISYLYKAVEEGFKDIEKIRTEPSFALFAGDERFTRLLESLVTPS
jgi:tetratricopeptide (TPR) repeat protein